MFFFSILFCCLFISCFCLCSIYNMYLPKNMEYARKFKMTQKYHKYIEVKFVVLQCLHSSWPFENSHRHALFGMPCDTIRCHTIPTIYNAFQSINFNPKCMSFELAMVHTNFFFKRFCMVQFEFVTHIHSHSTTRTHIKCISWYIYIYTLHILCNIQILFVFFIIIIFLPHSKFVLSFKF